MDGTLTMEREQQAEVVQQMLEGDLTSNAPVVWEDRQILPLPLVRLQEAAMILAQSYSVTPSLQGNERACLAVVYQAAIWRMDPVMVGSKAYLTPVKGGGMKLGYEAQLISAVAHAFAPLRRRPRFTFEGDGGQRFCTIRLWVKGEREPFVVASPRINTITPKNSPLWFNDPDQQLSYYTERAAIRRHFPEVLMGVYAIDELEVSSVTSLDRPDPYNDDEAPEVETELVEPSGGGKWKPTDAGVRTKDDDGQQSRRQAREASPGPSGGDGPKQEPHDMPALRNWAAEQQKAILLTETKAAGVPLWDEGLAKDKRWARLKTYDQELANTIKASIFAHFEKLP